MNHEQKLWYHGSPFILEELLEGSTITQEKDYARIFSHKPSVVSVNDDGTIVHNGSMGGYLYVIDEPISSADIFPHPNTTMSLGIEWLTRRAIKVKKITDTTPDPNEFISEEKFRKISKMIKIDY